MSIWLAIYLIGFGSTTGYVMGDCSGHVAGCHVVAPIAGTIWPFGLGAAAVEAIIK